MMDKEKMIEAAATVYRLCKENGNCWHCPFAHFFRDDDDVDSCCELMRAGGFPSTWKPAIEQAIDNEIMQKQMKVNVIKRTNNRPQDVK